MIRATRIATVAGDGDIEAAAAAAFAGRSDIELVMRCVDHVELVAIMEGAGIEAIVAFGAPNWLDARCGEEIASHGVRFVGVARHLDDADRLRALGATVLPGPAPIDEIVELSTTLPEPVEKQVKSRGGGSLTAVWGPKGSPGRTTVAIELAYACAASQHEGRVLLIDGDPYGGDIVQLLAITEEVPSIVWAAQSAAKGSFDETAVVHELRRVEREGPVVIPGLPRAELWTEVSTFGWNELLSSSRHLFQTSICDVGFCLEADEELGFSGGDGRNAIARASVMEADHVVAVLHADPVGLKSFLWGYQELKELVPPERIVVLANRCHPGVERDVADIIHRHTGKRVTAFLPDAPREMAQATMKGRPLSVLEPRSKFASATRDVAAAIGARVAPRGFLSRLVTR